MLSEDGFQKIINKEITGNGILICIIVLNLDTINN